MSTSTGGGRVRYTLVTVNFAGWPDTYTLNILLHEAFLLLSYFIRPPDLRQWPSFLPLCFLTSNSNLTAGRTSPRKKYIRKCVLCRTGKSNSVWHFANPFHNFYRGWGRWWRKYEIWSRFLLQIRQRIKRFDSIRFSVKFDLIRFEAVWFRNRATYQKCETCVGSGDH